MTSEGKKHARICREVVSTLLKRDFDENDIYLSHDCGGVLPKKPGHVALYRLKASERKKTFNRIKEPDITAQKDGRLLFIEVETQNSPRVAVGDLCCIDVSTHVCYRSEDDPKCIDSCLAMIVHGEFKKGSHKGEQFKRLQEALRFCGGVKDFRICTVSEFPDKLQDLLEKNPARQGRPEGAKVDDESISQEDLEAVEGILGHKFRDRALLVRALTHSTFAEEAKHADPDCRHQGALATLGDGVLRAVLTEHHYGLGSGEKGDITIDRVEQEKNTYLAKIGEDEGISDFIRAGRGATERGEKEGKKVRSDTIEALIGAVFLDCNYRTARDVALRLLRLTDTQTA